MELSDILKGTKKKNGSSLTISSEGSTSVTSTCSEGNDYTSYPTNKVNNNTGSDSYTNNNSAQEVVINSLSKIYNIPKNKIHRYDRLKTISDNNVPMLCYKIEQQFGCSIPPKYEKDLLTVGDLVRVLEKLGISSSSFNFDEDEESNEEELVDLHYRTGSSSDVEITNPSYDYDKDTGMIKFSMERLDNISEWDTGELAVNCWASENRYSFEDGWGNENYVHIGDFVIGHLEEGYGFPNVECSFEMSKDSIPSGSRWHFVFTINELSSDEKWYIIDFRNCPCNLSDEDYDVILSTISETLEVDIDDIEYESLFMDDFGADELDITEIIMELEKKFGVLIPDERVAEMSSVADLFDIIEDIL